MDALLSLLINGGAFIIALGILVTVHEFGHFWVARRCGVKVVRFSVGFGKPLFSFYRKGDPTEYVLAAIPLGGYVKMLDESEVEVADDEKPAAFNNQPLASKILIVLAGPVLNLIFAFLIFWLILVVGEKGLKPIVGELDKNGVAIQAGLESGDEITAVNGRSATIWRVAMGAITSGILDQGSVDITVNKNDGRFEILTLDFFEQDMPEANEIGKKLGIRPAIPQLKPLVDTVIKGGPADQAGLKSGDLIVSSNGVLVSSWQEWVKVTRSHPNKLLMVNVERAGHLMTLELTPSLVNEGDQTFGRIGVSVLLPKEVNDSDYSYYSLNPIAAVVEAARQTVQYSWLTLKMIGQMIVGRASVDNLSGPISLAKYAGQSASIGIVPFLKFLAFVSISLGVLNLLPIPMLDGGHLLFYFIQAVRGKAVPESVQNIAMRVGVFVLMAVMLLALMLDLNRIAS